MIKKNIVLFIIIWLLVLFPAFADNISIAQIDSSNLLLNQNILLYLSLTDNNGIPIENLKKDMFKIYESVNDKDFKEIHEIVSFKSKVNYTQGINFMLLLDNSGSMYYTIRGEKTEDESKMRITHAKKAVYSFLNSITNPEDTVGLVSYNTYYTLHSKLTKNKENISGFLDEITRPNLEEAYTELYASNYLAISEISTVKGRKVIIVLSDGINYPYYTYTKKSHKQFKDKIFKYTECIEYCQKEGVSVFAINLGRVKDKNLKDIVLETGGDIYNVSDKAELGKVYERIQKRVLNEYLITYKATMEPANKKYVKVEYKRGHEEKAVKRFYFSSTIFGIPLKDFSIFLLIPLFFAFILWCLLMIAKFEKKNASPSLEVLGTHIGSVLTKAIDLTGKKTVIGGSNNADMTLVGVPSVKDKHATVVFDEKKNNYTLVGEGDITVNNKPVKTKLLTAGDVINIGGTTIVFDEGDK